MKILVADDDPTSRLIVQIVLRNLGHDCVTASDGSEAWDLFLTYRPNVVISDSTMPGMTGLELCRSVREWPGMYAYFIMVTSHETQVAMLEGMRVGADDYLLKPLNPDDLQIRLIAAARVTALHRQLDAHQRELEAVNNGLSAIALLDPLTNLGNRRSLTEDLDLVEAQVVRYGRRSCMALMDIDYFKGFNDTYGHIAGDEALIAVALQLKKRARSGDAFYRYGGDEFVGLFPEQTLKTAAVAVQRIRLGIAELAIPHQGSTHGILTVSVGLALVQSGQAGPASDVLKEADIALYRAKEFGRNRTEYAEATLAAPVA